MIWKALVRVQNGEALDIQMEELGHGLLSYNDIMRRPLASAFGGYWIAVEYEDGEAT